MSMEATAWEFRNRAILFGLIFAVTFPLYQLDPVNASEALSNAIAGVTHVSADVLVRVVFAVAAVVMIAAASIRTWASSYLQASVVYAAAVRSDTLVADGPYRHVRNPLYFANVLMSISLGALMSRLGICVAVAAMLLICYRLIAREEAELLASQGAQYLAFRAAVPALWPSLRARIKSSRAKPAWRAGFKAEGWYWGFALALVSFAVTLKLSLFFVILGASVLLFWVTSRLLTLDRSV